VPTPPKLFNELFQEHLRAGTCAEGKLSSRWKDEAFAAAVSATVRALGYWKSGERAPGPTAFKKIVTQFFGDNPVQSETKADFVAAWTARRSGQAGSREPGAPPASPHRPRRASSGGADPTWLPEEPFVLRQGLGRLYVHHTSAGENQDPTPGNVVALEVTAETGRVYLRIDKIDDKDPVDATFAVTAAEIVVVRELNATPVRGTTLGADIPHPNVTFASSWHLKVPTASDGLPGGIVLAGDTLRQYATRGGLPYGIRVELRCRDIDLKPTDLPALPDISEKQRAVLRRVLQRHHADPDTGIVTLAGAELYRPADA
jgi:hypothetical protein